MKVQGATQFLTKGWFLSTQKTASFSLHAIFRSGENPVAFGIRGALDEGFALTMIRFVEGCPSQTYTDEQNTVVPARVGRFDGCVFLTGKARTFMRGWAEENERLVHVFPIFLCELDELDQLRHFQRFRRFVNLSDIGREAEPYFTFKMRGGASRLLVEKWSTEKFSTLISFIRVLSQEAGSSLEVRNRYGEVLSFSDPNSWENACAKVTQHLHRERHNTAIDGRCVL